MERKKSLHYAYRDSNLSFYVQVNLSLSLIKHHRTFHQVPFAYTTPPTIRYTDVTLIPFIPIFCSKLLSFPSFVLRYFRLASLSFILHASSTRRFPAHFLLFYLDTCSCFSSFCSTSLPLHCQDVSLFPSFFKRTSLQVV